MTPNNFSLKGEHMSQYIDLGREPTDLKDRQALIEGLLKAEEICAHEGLNLIQHRVFEFLVNEKDYVGSSIRANMPFKVSLPELDFIVKGDLAVVIGDTVGVIIKCAINSIESWERYSLAFGRTALEDYQIPYAIVTDSERYIVIDVIKGEVLGEGTELIPSYEELLRVLRDFTKVPYDSNKTVRERRILHAFNALRCSDESC